MTLALTILNQLLDRYEQPQRQRVVRVRLNEQDHAAYFSATDVQMRLAVHAELQELERQGILHLHWRKWEKGNWLTAIDLEPLHADVVYSYLKRTPHETQATALRELVLQFGSLRTSQPEWYAAFLHWASAQLNTYHSVAPLVLEDGAWNAELLRTLDAISQLDAPVLERVLSVRLFRDSKRFEELRGAVLTVLRRFDANAALYGDNDAALLRAHFLERAPEYVPLAGNIVLVCQETQLDLVPFTPSVALPATILRETKSVITRARYAVTVENAASFAEIARYAQAQNIIVLYTGGFASPSVLELLKTLKACGLGLFHWGDLDVGGLRILAHLRKNLGNVQPLGMNTEISKSHQAFARPLNVREHSALETLRGEALLADCAPLIDSLLATNRKLEQEAVRVKTVLDELEASPSDHRIQSGLAKDTQNDFSD